MFSEFPVIALQLNNGTGGIKICFSKYVKNKCMLNSYQQTLVGDINSAFLFISIEIILFKRGQTKLSETSTHLQNSPEKGCKNYSLCNKVYTTVIPVLSVRHF